MKIPQNTPQWIYGDKAQKKRYEVKEREVVVTRKVALPEEVDIALTLHASDIAKLLGGDIDQTTAILDLLYRSKIFRELLTKARKNIKAKRGTDSDRDEGGND